MTLTVGETVLRDFKSWSADADMYQAASAWQAELSVQETDVRPGQECKLAIGKTQVLTGLVDSVSRSYSKDATSLRIAGRDLMGLVVDSYCESFVSLAGMSIKGIAEQLLRTVPYINRKSIIYRNGADRLAAKRSIQVDADATVFEVLREVADSRGLLFYCMPDGTLVFSKPLGKPVAGGKPTFSLEYRDKNRSRIKSAEMVDDFSQRYSKVTVISQQQSYEDISAGAVNVKASRTDSEVPYYKPFVESVNDDSQSPSLLARQRIEQQRWRGRELRYTVAGHAQNGNVWAIDDLCMVRDDRFGLLNSLLICGRTLRYSRDEGSETEVRLCTPGVVA
jgi:prophage tail gpP-like protein